MEEFDWNMSIDTYNYGRSTCERSFITCAAYHYLRPILRQLGTVASPYTHSRFFHAALLGILSASERPRIAISGTADYAWFLPDSPLAAASSTRLSELRVVVSDACLTPIRQSMLAARQTGIHVEALQVDVRTGFLLRELDVVITDAFLTQFSAASDRLAILCAWRRSLRPEGAIITTAQVRSRGPKVPSFRGRTFIDNVADLYEHSSYPAALSVGREVFTRLLREHTSGTTSRVYETEEELIDEVVQSGLTIRDMQTMTWHSPALDEDLTYRELVLARS